MRRLTRPGSRRGAGLGKSRFGSLQVLIPNGELLLQGIQLRVAKHFPPVATDGLVAGLGGLPPVTLLEGGRRRFFESRRYWGRRCFVLWPHHAAVEQQRQGHRVWRYLLHCVLAWFTRTCVPVINESVGFKITGSERSTS